MDNRIAYGLAKKHGIDTKGMSPKEVWEALKGKGVTPESVDREAQGKQKELEKKYNDDLPLDVRIAKGRKEARKNYAEGKEGWRQDLPSSMDLLIKQAYNGTIDKLLATIYQSGGSVDDLQGLIVPAAGRRIEGLKSENEIANLSYNELKEYKENAQKIANEAIKQEENQKKYAEERQTEQKQREEDYHKKIAEMVGAKTSEKLSNAANYRLKKEKELSVYAQKLLNAKNGYVDGKKSVRAVKAELNGKFPASEAAKMLGTTTKKIQSVLTPSEWHHSGGDMYNKVDYYDISKFVALLEDDDLFNDKDYSEEVAILKKLY